MKTKDQQLLEEAYQSIYEANFLGNMIDKGKEMLGMGPSKPLTFEQAKEQFTKTMQELGYKVSQQDGGYSVKAFYPDEANGNWEYVWNITPGSKESMWTNRNPHFSWIDSREKRKVSLPNGVQPILPDPFSKEQLEQEPSNETGSIGRKDFPLTTANLQAVLKPAKEIFKLTTKAIAQFNKEAPEREEKERKEREEYGSMVRNQRMRSIQDTKNWGIHH